MMMRERNIPGRENSEFKGPEVGINTACARNSQKARMALIW